jgi:hypothetical protein
MQDREFWYSSNFDAKLAIPAGPAAQEQQKRANSISTRKSGSLSLVLADFVTVLDNALCFPCPSGRATAARCANQPQTTGSKLRTLVEVTK